VHCDLDWRPLVCRLAVGVGVFALLISACAFERIPEAPGNAAIQYAVALREQDIDTARKRTCEASDPDSLEFESPETFGGLEAFYRAQIGRGVLGGDSEFPPSEQVDLEVDNAWTEIVLTAEGEPDEVWRLHLTRENGGWKVCDAELRS